jgi:hypothetical protein
MRNLGLGAQSVNSGTDNIQTTESIGEDDQAGREVDPALGQLAGTIDAARMREMNLAVDQDGRSPAAVAAAFLMELRGNNDQRRTR